MKERVKPEDAEVVMNVSHDIEQGLVVMTFPNQSMRLGLPPQTAVEISLALIRHAEAIEQEASVKVPLQTSTSRKIEEFGRG